MLLVNSFTLGFSVFDEKDYFTTFQKFDRDGSGTISKAEVEEFLFETYGFPPIQDEVDLFMQEFDSNQDGRISWDEFINAIDRIKQRMDMKAERAKEYIPNFKSRWRCLTRVRANNKRGNNVLIKSAQGQQHGHFAGKKLDFDDTQYLFFQEEVKSFHFRTC